MTVYTVRFCDKEFEANNLRDFARIAVFAKWYLRSQSSQDGLHCSVRNQEAVAVRNIINMKEAEAALARNRSHLRRSRASVMRKALRSFLYNVFA